MSPAAALTVLLEQYPIRASSIPQVWLLVTGVEDNLELVKQNTTVHVTFLGPGPGDHLFVPHIPQTSSMQEMSYVLVWILHLRTREVGD